MTLVADLTVVSGMAIVELAPVWALDDGEIPAALADALPATLETYALAAGAVAADTYDDMRDAAGVGGRFAAIVAPLRDFGVESLVLWGTEPLRRETPDLAVARSLIEGAMSKRIVNAANESFTLSASEDPKARGYQRVTRPGGCRFCQMVAGRGGVYTKASATFACHENCFCSAVPAWGGRPVPVKAYEPSDRPMNDADRARVREWITKNL